MLFDLDPIAVAKVVGILVLGLGSFLLGLLPFKLAKWCGRRHCLRPAAAARDAQARLEGGLRHGHSHHSSTTDSPVVSVLLCFGGGVLLYTTLLHLQPEVRDQCEMVFGDKHMGDWIFCAGFFAVFLIDEAVHWLVDRSADDGEIPGSARMMHRSASLRRRPVAEAATTTTTAAGTSGTRTDVVDQSLNETDDRWDRTMGFNTVTKPVPRDRRRGETAVTLTGSGYGSDEHAYWLSGLFAVAALSFHEVFEGLAIGLEQDESGTYNLILAVAAHKLVIAFCVGMELMSSSTRKTVVIAYVAVFSFVSPLGILIGMRLASYEINALSVVLQGVASGTLLYVVFFEVLARHKKSGFRHLLAIVAGFSLMIMLQLFLLPSHEHSSGHHDDHDHASHHHDDHDHASHHHHHH